MTSNGGYRKVVRSRRNGGLCNVHTRPYIEPIRVIRTLLFEGARLDEIDPIRNLELAGAL